MNKDRLFKLLNMCTKDELVDFILDLYDKNGNDGTIDKGIVSINRERVDEKERRASDNFDKTKKEYLDYIQELQKKYGKEVRQFDLDTDEHLKYLDLKSQYYDAFEKWQKVSKGYDKLYEEK